MSKKLISIIKKKIYDSGIDSDTLDKVCCIIDQAYEENKRPESKNIVSRIIASYDSFFKYKVGVGAKIGAIEGKKAKSIGDYLLKNINKPELGDDGIVEAWEFILNNYDHWDSFHKKQLTLSQIDSNLPNILNSIKNGRKQQFNNNAGSTANQAAGVIEAIRRRNGGRGEGNTPGQYIEGK